MFMSTGIYPLILHVYPLSSSIQHLLTRLVLTYYYSIEVGSSIEDDAFNSYFMVFVLPNPSVFFLFKFYLLECQ